MTKQQKETVQKWLYSIKKTEFMLTNLQQSLEKLETRYISPPTWVQSLDTVAVSGGNYTSSPQEIWVQFLEEYPVQKSFLMDQIETQKRKLEQYKDTLALIEQDAKWGSLGVEIIKYKYYQKVRPDKLIYTKYLFCHEQTFYSTNRKIINFFFETLPDVFQNKII